jgi:hypothetical protein
MMATTDLLLLEQMATKQSMKLVSAADGLSKGSVRMSPIYCQSTSCIFSTRVLLFEIPVGH